MIRVVPPALAALWLDPRSAIPWRSVPVWRKPVSAVHADVDPSGGRDSRHICVPTHAAAEFVRRTTVHPGPTSAEIFVAEDTRVVHDLTEEVGRPRDRRRRHVGR